jgi:2,3-bisphosphoglycerate-dependent phosphoglycerate mutase
MDKTLYIVRHAQSQSTKTLDNSLWPLSDVGQAQARALAPLLMPLGITRLFSSPYARTMATIEPFSREAKLEIHVREGLHERKIIHLETDDFVAAWTKSWVDYDYTLPNCETNREARTRIVAAILGVISECEDDVFALCSHGAVMGLFLNTLDASVGREDVEQLLNPDVIKILIRGATLTWDRSYKLPGLSSIATGYPR